MNNDVVIIVHGLRSGYQPTIYKIGDCSNISDINVLSDIRDYFDTGITFLGKKGFLLQNAQDGFWFSAVELLFDGLRGAGKGFIAFSVYIPKTKKIAGADLKRSLDGLLNGYQGFIQDFQTGLIPENWSYIDKIFEEIAITDRSKPKSLRYDTGSKGRFAYLDIKEDEIIQYLDKPFQSEYGEYEGVFLTSTLRNVQNVTKKLEVDLSNVEYEIIWQGENNTDTRYPISHIRNSEIKSASQEFTKDFYYPKTVAVADGEINESEETITVSYPVLEPVKKEVCLSVKSTDGSDITSYDVRVINSDNEYQGGVSFKVESDVKTLVFSGEEIGEKCKIEISADNHKSFSKEFTPNELTFIPVTLEKQYKHYITLSDNNGYSVCGYFNISGKTNFVELISKDHLPVAIFKKDSSFAVKVKDETLDGYQINIKGNDYINESYTLGEKYLHFGIYSVQLNKKQSPVISNNPISRNPTKKDSETATKKIKLNFQDKDGGEVDISLLKIKVVSQNYPDGDDDFKIDDSHLVYPKKRKIQENDLLVVESKKFRKAKLKLTSSQNSKLTVELKKKIWNQINNPLIILITLFIIFVFGGMKILYPYLKHKNSSDENSTNDSLLLVSASNYLKSGGWKEDSLKFYLDSLSNIKPPLKKDSIYQQIDLNYKFRKRLNNCNISGNCGETLQALLNDSNKCKQVLGDNKFSLLKKVCELPCVVNNNALKDVKISQMTFSEIFNAVNSIIKVETSQDKEPDTKGHSLYISVKKDSQRSEESPSNSNDKTDSDHQGKSLTYDEIKKKISTINALDKTLADIDDHSELQASKEELRSLRIAITDANEGQGLKDKVYQQMLNKCHSITGIIKEIRKYSTSSGKNNN